MAEARGPWRGLGAVRGLVFANGVTSFGASITEFALPLVALSLLHASAATVAALYSVSLAAQAAASLPVGVWVDRTDQKRSMIIGLVAGAVVVLCVPLGVATGRLSIGLLLLVAVGSGLTSTIVQVSAQTLVPFLARDQALVSANAGLNFGRSLGSLVGPGAGGVLVGLLGAGSALLFDGASQLVSTLFLLRLPSPATVRGALDRPHKAVRLGVQAVTGDPVLLRIFIGTTVCNVGGGLIGSLYFPYAYHDLRLTPVLLGTAAMIGNVGLLMGSALAARVIRRFGLARAGLAAVTVAITAFLLIPAASFGPPFVLLTAYEFLFASNMSVFRVCVATLRHQRTRAELQGRVFSVVLLGPMFGAPLGALLATTLVLSGLSVLGAIGVGVAIGMASLTVYWLPGWRRAAAVQAAT
jgi:MFS family permease